jgi:RNA-directed DNA polymerase
MPKAMRQMPEQSGRASAASGEAVSDIACDEACGPPLEHQETGLAKLTAGTGGLLEAALTRQNLNILIERLKRRIDDAGVIRLILNPAVTPVA